MFSADVDRIMNQITNHPLWESYTTSYVPSKFSTSVKEDKAYVALSVLGHDPKGVEINSYEDRIQIKSKKSEEDSVFNDLVKDIDETIKLGKDLDGTTTKAEIKNGILTLVIEKKEESKPKKVTIKVV